MTRYPRLLRTARRSTNQPGDDGFTPDATRRSLLLAGVGLLLTGCAQSPRAELPLLTGPEWDRQAPNPAPGNSAPVEMHPPIEITQARTATSTPSPSPLPSAPPITNTISRRSWASGREVPSLMNPMTRVHHITIHHDGMRPFFADDRRSAAARLEAIRRAHRDRKWGDIGYHFAVDRAGNVWECRPLRYQGAHVKNYNPGNIGIVALGNFDEQHPTQAQLAALHRHIVSLMRGYGVPARNLRTHQQWAATLCPGRHMQRFVDTGMNNRMFG